MEEEKQAVGFICHRCHASFTVKFSDQQAGTVKGIFEVDGDGLVPVCMACAPEAYDMTNVEEWTWEYTAKYEPTYTRTTT